jgi:hypothetical protein
MEALVCSQRQSRVYLHHSYVIINHSRSTAELYYPKMATPLANVKIGPWHDVTYANLVVVDFIQCSREEWSQPSCTVL